MGVVTRTGDDGTTALMYGRRVPKTHPRVEAYGAIDELNSALGLARGSARHDFVREHLVPIQQDLVGLMGELATEAEDLARYKKDGFALLTPDKTARLDALANTIEEQKVYGKGWAMPGEDPNAAALDLARSICRRAERQVCLLQQQNEIQNAEIIRFLNRLSDVLWLLARWVEAQKGK